MSVQTHLRVPEKRHHSSIQKIAFYGSADADQQHPLYQEAFRVAEHLARFDKIIVNGGGPGVMDAATRGARAGGGRTIGVTFYPKDMPEFEGRYWKNIVDKEIKTVSYIERMFGLMEQADLFICFQGGTGTLSEWATAWLLAHLYYGHHKPLVLYGEFWHEVMDVIDKHFFIGAKEHDVYRIAKDVDEVMVAINEFEAHLHDRCGLPPRPKHYLKIGYPGEADKYALPLNGDGTIT